jgi:uncharacterized protein YuzE
VTITIGTTTFDRVDYDPVADVLYLHVGDPSTAVDFDESPEGHALRFGPSGQLVGITIVRARQLVEEGRPIDVTIPVPEHVAVDPQVLAQAVRAA